MALNTRINLDNWTPADPSNPLKSLAHEIGDQLDALEKKIPAGVAGKGFASGYVDAGQFVTLDNLKFSVTTGGSRGLCCATVSGTVALSIAAHYYMINGGCGGNATGFPQPVYTTTASTSWFGWSFPNAGDGSTYMINDTVNQRVYRVQLLIGYGYLKNFISVERLY